MIDLVNGELVQVAATLGGGGKTMKVQEFNSSGTWVRPAGVDAVYSEIGGAGGGGAGGLYFYRMNSAYSNTNDHFSLQGGNGGGGQVRTQLHTVTGDLSIVLGAGGVGGYEFVTPTNFDAVSVAMAADRKYGSASGTEGGDSFCGSIKALGGGAGRAIVHQRVSWDGTTLSKANSVTTKPNGTRTVEALSPNSVYVAPEDSAFWRRPDDVFQKTPAIPMITADGRGMSGYSGIAAVGSVEEVYYRNCLLPGRPEQNRAYYQIGYAHSFKTFSRVDNGRDAAKGCGGSGAKGGGSLGYITAYFNVMAPCSGGNGGNGFCRIVWWE